MTIPALCFLMLSCSFLILKHNKISITSIEQNSNCYLIILAEDKLRKNDIPPLWFIVNYGNGSGTSNAVKPTTACNPNRC